MKAVNRVVAAVVAHVRRQPVVYGYALLSLVLGVVKLSAVGLGPAGWVVAVAPLAVAFLVRTQSVPWAKVRPLFDRSAGAAGQVFPAEASWFQTIEAAVDYAATSAEAAGWPIPATPPQWLPVVTEAPPAVVVTPEPPLSADDAVPALLAEPPIGWAFVGPNSNGDRIYKPPADSPDFAVGARALVANPNPGK